ncbi:recombinase XerD [Sulfolobales archaeon HS-7]|nr:recombinase XerD [Sulfolobales archaeon HS-7]
MARYELGESSEGIEPVTGFINALRMAGAGEGTIRLYGKSIQLFLSYVKKDPWSVTPNDVNSWIQHLYSKGESPATIKVYIISVRRFLKWLNKDIKTPIPRIRRKESVSLKGEEIERLKRACKTLSEKVLINLLLDTGIRSSELLSITKKDVEIENKLIRLKRTKSGEPRVVFFTTETQDILRAYMSELKGDKLFDLTYFGLYKKIKTIAKRAGLDVRPHILRHTFATQALRKNMPITILQKILGHKDIRTTQIYTHLVTEDIKRYYEETFEKVGKTV